MGMTPAPTLEEAILAAKRFLGELPVPLVIPDAGYVLPDPAGETAGVRLKGERMHSFWNRRDPAQDARPRGDGEESPRGRG